MQGIQIFHALSVAEGRQNAGLSGQVYVCCCLRYWKGDYGLICIYALLHASLSWFLSFRWLVIAVGLVRAYLAKGSYHSLYYSIEKPLKFFQTGALLEVGVVFFLSLTNICMAVLFRENKAAFVERCFLTACFFISTYRVIWRET